MSEIVITGIPELLAKIDRMQAIKVLAPPMVRSMARLQRSLATYPKASHRKMTFVSEKQRRYVMWLVREGKVPYVRTRLLGRAWKSDIDTSAGGVTGILSNPTPYGPFVMSPSQQAAYHSGTWGTTDTIAEKHEQAIVADFKRAIDGALA